MHRDMLPTDPSTLGNGLQRLALPRRFMICTVLLTWMMLGTSGCRTGYYAVMEKFGKHKRDLLRQSLTEATEQQREVEEQFKDALTRLMELTGATGGELLERYEAFKSEYESSKEKADGVQAHISEVEQVAEDLFDEL